jgi:predicted metal-dependent hydrolase
MKSTKVEDICRFSFGTNQIMYRIRFSQRKTLGITVRPDTSVIVSAPPGTRAESILRRVKKKAKWIRKQQRYFENFFPPITPRRYVSGETHRYLGRQYRLKVVEGRENAVKLKGEYLWVYSESKKNTAAIEKLAKRWFAQRAADVFEKRMDICVRKFRGRILQAPKLRIRRMLKRWGSFTSKGYIVLNLDLIRMPVVCVDYVLVHELCHVLQRHHGNSFYHLLVTVMPDWEARKERLEKAAVAS